MKLSTRLLLLILGCLLPMIAAEVYTQASLHQRRQQQLGTLALRQVELANSDVASVIEGVVQLAATVAHLPEVASFGPACTERLVPLQKSLRTVRFLAVADPAGRLACTSAPSLTGPAGMPAEWLTTLLADPETRIGTYTAVPGMKGGFLPILVPLPLGQGAESGGYLVTALDPRWFAAHMADLKNESASLLARSSLIIADRNGIVVGRYPEGDNGIGQPMPAALRPLLSATAPGVNVLTDAKGDPRLTAYIPPNIPPLGLIAIESLSLPDLNADLEIATGWHMTVLAGSVLIALLLAWLAGRRFIYQPTEALLQAARRWRDGDLSVRAKLTESGSEFGSLAESFNAMAAGLQARELERRLQAQFLEAQVAERTRELSDSNNRLQVEIAGRERTEAALHQAQKLQAVGQLAGGIAHDFNNMLATVLGNLELMERRVAQSLQCWTEGDAERLSRLIARATGAVQRGAQLTSRLLAFSRRQPLAARSTDLNRLVAELVTLASSTLGRRIRVVSDLAPDLWPAMVDASQLEAAILNLCLNARDAMPEGGQLTIRTANRVLATPEHDDDPPPGPYVEVCVTDTGIGMSAEIRRRAFDPFFTTKGPGGSGLGLSQVYGMARQSGGTVHIESTPGEGTQVSLLLPRAMDEADALAARTDDPDETPHRPGPAELVLVVDDDHAVRQVTVEMLHDLGCEVVQASGGVEALALLDGLTASPRLILLDYAMPGMNGLHLARLLRERGLTAPIALVTGYAELADSDAHASPLDGLLRKPFTIRELRGLLVQLRAGVSEPATPSLAASLRD